MRPVHLPPDLVAKIRQHSRETYPDECCGFLIALADPAAANGPRSVVSVQRAPNDFGGERRRRFVIRPEELRSAERALEGSDRIIAGFYHSHPDHPARPSAFDQDHAWPWYTYVVVSVTATESPAIGAFELDPDSASFLEVPMLSGPSADPQVTESLSASGGK
jgi:proteasome lid subunit RPN8/RPN11